MSGKFSNKKYFDLIFDLINAFSITKHPMQSALLMQDLLTKNEINILAKRLRIAKYLLSGATHRSIAADLHCSVSTVTKVNLWLEQGGDGLREVISKLPKRTKMPEKLPKGPIEFHLPQLILATTEYAVANKETARIKKFVDATEKKRVIDKHYQKAVDDLYRSKQKVRGLQK